MTKLAEARKTGAYYLTQPAVWLLAKTPITPNAISWAGFLITVGAALLIVSEHLFAAGLVALLAGFFDILDGALARSANRTTKFGGILDSTLDRLSEAALLLGILVRYAREPSVTEVLVVGLALVGSILVSYVRARAEAAGLECQVGLFTRTERVIVLALGLLLSQISGALLTALVIIMVFTFITVGQRLLYVWRQAKN
ncbi:MAG: CDP-alcohol phosphatidyltransferase family protein [Chloroflexi bacterium]|nr:CDP-alcohol phosphatidyltransferase family protein [Chloroflexota bacterium]